MVKSAVYIIAVALGSWAMFNGSHIAYITQTPISNKLFKLTLYDKPKAMRC